MNRARSVLPGVRPASGLLVLAVISTVLSVAVVVAFSFTAKSRAAAQDASSGPEPVAQGTSGAVVVATKPLDPFVIVESEAVDGSGLAGYSIDVWHEIADRLGLETQWVVDSSVSDILERVRDGEVDAAIAGISMTAEREAFVDFAHPYFDSGLHVATTPTGGRSAFASMFDVATSGTVVALAASLVLVTIVVAHLVWLSERRDNPEFPTDYRQGISEALWWSTVSVITGGEAVKDIRRPLSRLLAVAWLIVGLFLIAFVTAQAASSLTVNELSNDIDGPDDLPGHSVVTVEGTVAESYLETLNVRAATVPDIDTALAAVADGSYDAFVYDSPVLAFEIASNYAGRLELAGSMFAPDPYGIALTTGSDLREPINSVLLEMSRDGTLEALNVKWLGISR